MGGLLEDCLMRGSILNILEVQMEYGNRNVVQIVGYVCLKVKERSRLKIETWDLSV